MFDPTNAEAVLEARREGGRNGSKTAKAKGGVAGKGVKKPRKTAAGKELLPQGVCTGCGETGVAGLKHAKWSKELGKVKACGYFR
jgi:hypothetical protein